MKSRLRRNPLLRLPVKGLDVAKRMAELESRHPNFIRRQAVKHECIVGVRAVGTEISRTGEDTVLIRLRNPVLSMSVLENPDFKPAFPNGQSSSEQFRHRERDAMIRIHNCDPGYESSFLSSPLQLNLAKTAFGASERRQRRPSAP